MESDAVVLSDRSIDVDKSCRYDSGENRLGWEGGKNPLSQLSTSFDGVMNGLEIVGCFGLSIDVAVFLRRFRISDSLSLPWRRRIVFLSEERSHSKVHSFLHLLQFEQGPATEIEYSA